VINRLDSQRGEEKVEGKRRSKRRKAANCNRRSKKGVWEKGISWGISLDAITNRRNWQKKKGNSGKNEIKNLHRATE